MAIGVAVSLPSLGVSSLDLGRSPTRTAPFFFGPRCSGLVCLHPNSSDPRVEPVAVPSGLTCRILRQQVNDRPDRVIRLWQIRISAIRKTQGAFSRFAKTYDSGLARAAFRRFAGTRSAAGSVIPPLPEGRGGGRTPARSRSPWRRKSPPAPARTSRPAGTAPRPYRERG